MSYPIPESPLADAIAQIIGKKPPMPLTGIWRWEDCSDRDSDDLAEWLGSEIDSTDFAPWMTAYGVIEAAELLLSTAIENSNLKPEGGGNA
jgi:hypothetical protein